jgi:hypothetical protein
MDRSDLPRPDRSREIHNAAIDERIALAGQCGTKHLPSGRICGLPAGHRGGCEFTAALVQFAQIAPIRR